MKTKTLTTLILAAVMIVAAVPSFAQTLPTSTTLSAALASGTNSTLVTLTSLTGISASTNSVQTFIMVDREIMRVRTLPASGTTITVVRAINGPAVGHASGARVTYGPGGGTWNTAGSSNGVFLTSGFRPSGTCTRAQNQFLPLYAVDEPPRAYDCNGGVWVGGNLPDMPPNAITLVGPCTVPIGSVAYGSFGTSITASTTVEYTASIFVPYSFVSTGFTNLNGSAVDTASKKVFVLRDAAGAVLANTLLAGTLATGNDAFQAIAWTAPRLIVGPARYFVGLQDDTADANGIRTIAASTFNGVVAVGNASVFGTVPVETMPSTFTADVGPIGCLY